MTIRQNLLFAKTTTASQNCNENNPPLPSFGSLEATVLKNRIATLATGSEIPLSYDEDSPQKSVRTRKRRRPQQMLRYYDCQDPSCRKAYESISHLNTHIKRKGHGNPLSKTDFKFK